MLMSGLTLSYSSLKNLASAKGRISGSLSSCCLFVTPFAETIIEDNNKVLKFSNCFFFLLDSTIFVILVSSFEVSSLKTIFIPVEGSLTLYPSSTI